MDFKEDELTFEEADRLYAGLRRRYEAGDIDDEAFGEQLKRLMVLDERGRWWARSRTSGEWHFHDGSSWVRGAPPHGSSERPEPKPPVEALRRTCAEYSGHRYYVAEAIPEELLSEARKRFPIPANEYVVALVDSSSFLTKGCGLAVCEDGIRWRNDTASVSMVMAQGYLGWRDFATVHIVVYTGRTRRYELSRNEYGIEMGEGDIFVCNSTSMYAGRSWPMRADDLVRLLSEIQTLIRREASSVERTQDGL